MLVRHDEELRCPECNGEMEPIPHSSDGESRFAFAMTQHKDGSVIDPPFLVTIEAAYCRSCGKDHAFLDSLTDDQEEAAIWAALPKWETAH